jgi:hypothetical protein
MKLDTGNPEIHSAQELIRRSFNSLGKMEVQISDQTSPVVIVPANQTNNISALSADATIDARTVTVDNTTGFVDGTFVVITNVDSRRYYTGYQVGAVAGNVVTLDTPLDFAYETGDQITNGTTDLAVDGSATPQIFSLRAAEPPGGVNVVVDITRILFVCETTNAVDLNKFGDIVGGLVNGLVCRRRDGTYNNLFNLKTNGDMAGIMYDWTPYVASNPSQGINGFVARLTFASQGKIGVSVRVGQGEDFELIVQDNQSTIVRLNALIEGHVVQD